MRSDDLVRLDTSGDVWFGDFPGLGSVSIAADGAISVACSVDPAGTTGPYGEPGAESARRFDALRWGWAEPLSWLRRGYELTTATVGAPGGGALVLAGPVDRTLVVLHALVELGWTVFSTGVTPVRVRDDVIFAHPSAAPILVPRRMAREWDLESQAARADTDAVRVDLARPAGPEPVLAVIYVLVRQVGDPDRLTRIRGGGRLRLAAGLIHAGPLGSDDQSPATLMARDLLIAGIEAAEVRVDEDATTIDPTEVVSWWDEVADRG